MIRSDAMVLRIAVDNKQAKRELEDFSQTNAATARKVERTGKRIERANKKAANSVTELRATMLKVGVAVGAITAAAIAIDRIAKKADEIDNLGRAFGTLSGRIGTTASVFIPQMRAATQGLISDMDLMQQANQAILLGLPITDKTFADLANKAVKLGKAMGIDAKSAVESLTVGIGRQSKLWLDNLGIIIDTEKAYKDYAATLGVTATQLTDAQKKQAFFNATMLAADSAVEGLTIEVDTLAGKWNQAKTAMVNYFDGVVKAVNEAPRTLGADIAGAGGVLGFLDLQGMTPEQSDARARSEATRVTASEARKNAQNASRNLNEAEQALAKTQAERLGGLTEEVFLRNQAWDIMKEQHQTARDIASLTGPGPTGQAVAPGKGDDSAIRGQLDADADAMIAAATAADKALYDTIGENLDGYLATRRNKELAAIESEYAIKVAQVITGEEMITEAMLAALEERNLATMELSEEKHAALLQLAREEAAATAAASAGQFSANKKWSEMEVKDKKKAGLQMASVASSMASQAFKDSKGLQMGQTAIRTAAAVMNAMANIPAPANIAFAAVTAAMGVAQLAAIQKAKAPGAAHGTIISGGSRGFDSVPYNLMHGEAVLPAGLTSLLQNAAAQNNASSGTVQGGIEADTEVGGVTYQINIQAVDARSFQELMEDNPQAFASAFHNAAELQEL